MNAEEWTTSARAGTLESMDCLVSMEHSGGGRSIEVSGSGAVRFMGAIQSKITDVLDELEREYPGMTRDLKISVQDNGAMDLVLGARLEAAFVRYAAMSAGGAQK